MQVQAQHRETGQEVKGLLTTAKRALPNTWANWNLDPRELVIKEQHNSCSYVYELSKVKNVVEIRR